MERLVIHRKKTAEAFLIEIKEKQAESSPLNMMIGIVIEELKGEETMAAIWIREGIATTLYYRWKRKIQMHFKEKRQKIQDQLKKKSRLIVGLKSCLGEN